MIRIFIFVFIAFSAVQGRHKKPNIEKFVEGVILCYNGHRWFIITTFYDIPYVQFISDQKDAPHFLYFTIPTSAYPRYLILVF